MKIVTRSTNPVALSGLVFILLFIVGCSSTQNIGASFEPIVYPPPPDEARFIFEQTLMNSTQVSSSTKEMRMRQMLTGETMRGTSMSKPFDVSVCQGRVFVSDSVQRIVHVFDYPQHRYFAIGTKEPGILVKPLGVVTDGNCNLFVADATQKRVVMYNHDGEFITAFGGKKWFSRLTHVAVNADGTRLFATDTGASSGSLGHKIKVFDIGSGEHLYDIGSRGHAEGLLNLPRDLTIGPQGNVYVVDGGNFRVQEFTAEGDFVRAFGEIGTRMGQFSRPKGISLDPQGNLYVSDATFGNFQIFNPEGRLLLFVGTRANDAGPGKFLLPAGIDVDEDGRVYFIGQFFRKLDIFRPAALAKEEGFLGAFY